MYIISSILVLEWSPAHVLIAAEAASQQRGNVVGMQQIWADSARTV